MLDVFRYKICDKLDWKDVANIALVNKTFYRGLKDIAIEKKKDMLTFTKEMKGEMTKMDKTYKVPKNLIFNPSDNREDWHLPDDVKIGMVGCFTADRCPCWDVFIVVDFDPNTHRITAIFPEIQYDTETTNIKIGQDNLNISRKKKEKEIICVCESYYGCDGYCNCGASDERLKRYANSFKEMPPDTKYKALRFIHDKFRNFNYIYHEFCTKTEVNTIMFGN